MASRRIGTQLGGANRLHSSVGNVSGLASCQVCERGSGHCGESSKHLRKIRVGTLNVNTLRGRVCEVVETLSRRKVYVCCIQETRYRGGNCRTIKGKDTRYKLYWSGNDKGTAGVEVFVAEEWIEKVFEVQRVSDRIILVKLIVGPACGYLLSVYAPQSPIAVCRTGVGSSSIVCNGCKHWVHKKCGGLKRLKKDPDYRCTRCQGTVCPLDGRPQKEVQGGPDKLEVVASFCYLGDMLSAAEGCELSTTTCVKSAWKKFKDLLPVLSSLHLFQNMWPCIQLLCAECNAPCLRDLDIDTAKPPASAAK